jgi:hypothetical protein
MRINNIYLLGKVFDSEPSSRQKVATQPQSSQSTGPPPCLLLCVNVAGQAHQNMVRSQEIIPSPGFLLENIFLLFSHRALGSYLKLINGSIIVLL